MRLYAIKAKDTELVWWAAELKLEAERKGGALLAEMAKNGERDTVGGNRKSLSQPAIMKLSDFGISPSKSS